MTELSYTAHPTSRIGGTPETYAYLRSDLPSIPPPSIPPIIEDGVIIQPFVTVDSGTATATRVGADSILLAHVHVGHDVQIGKRVTIATSSVIGGHAVIEDDVRIGINATVLSFRRIGKGAHIGAGAVVTKDVPAGETWAGNPARPIAPNAIAFTARGDYA